MTAVILAAGTSSRLRPLTESLPKTLLPVRGKPLLQRILEAISGAGIDRVVIVTGYLHGHIERFLGDFPLRLPVECIFNPLFATTNNSSSLLLVRGAVAGEEILLLDSDILFSPAILPLLLSSRHPDALIVRLSSSIEDEEIKLVLDADLRVLRIGREIPAREAQGESIGIEKFSSRSAAALFDVLEERSDRQELYEASFQRIIDAGTPVYAVDCGTLPCLEIDTPEDLREAEKLADRYRL